MHEETVLLVCDLVSIIKVSFSSYSHKSKFTGSRM
jgi:hypothetical protein